MIPMGMHHFYFLMFRVRSGRARSLAGWRGVSHDFRRVFYVGQCPPMPPNYSMKYYRLPYLGESVLPAGGGQQKKGGLCTTLLTFILMMKEFVY